MYKTSACRLILISLLAFPAACQAQDMPLRDAVECRAREGLPNVFVKLRQGQVVRIAYLGGSITAQQGWRPKTLNWFRSQFPEADISEINAAIGGTGSDLGVFRLQQDVLDHRPDLLFVEFAVNDGGAPVHRIHQAMEGIVRQTIKADPSTDICFVYTLVGGWTQTLRGGKFPRAASAMEVIADHYGIPSIHMGLKVARLEGQGTLLFAGAKPKTEAEKAALGGRIVFSPDNVHPYPDSGHELYLQAVIRSMAQIREVGKPGTHRLPAPFALDHWEAAKMVSLSQATLSPGWKNLDPAKSDLARRFKHRMPEMFYTNQPGQTIILQFKGTGLRLYDLLGPDCGQIKVILDDGPPVIKPRFDAYCTYHRLATLTLAENLPDAMHTVTLELHADQPDKAAILAKRNERMDTPERFDDTAWYVGAIMVLGDLVTTEENSEDALLTRVQAQTFQYFWDGAEPHSGMALERIHVGDARAGRDRYVVTSGGSGFGVMAILVGMDRGFISRDAGVERLDKIIGFLEKADRYHGAWAHWLNGETGKTVPFGKKDDGADLVETAYLAQGLLAVRQYLARGSAVEQALAHRVDTMWREIEWDWFRREGQNVLYWHWSPKHGWDMNHQIRGYNECLITYVLAAASPTHGIPAAVYHQGWARQGDIVRKTGDSDLALCLKHNGAGTQGGPLFWAHYSFLGLDPRGLKDAYADYWTHNRNHTLLNRQHCIDNPFNYLGYGENCWGLTASYSVKFYAGHSPSRDLGVISPTAALSSFPYTPEASMQVLKHLNDDLGDKLWGPYGFYDAFSEKAGWYPHKYLAIDQGPIVVMIENHRSALLWDLFMSSPEVQQGLKKLGFTSAGHL
ncbi:MAG: hypothetical protein GY809_12405 [Planctomycetes bacterium]|nr:hypothetical protein [Planctomycetota bacterium]